MTIKGGSGAGGLTPNGKTILNFHFDYLHPSLRVDEDDGLFSLDILYSWKEILLLTWEDGMWAKEA